MALSTPASGTSLDVADLLGAAPSAATTSLWRDAWRRLIRNKLAVVGGVTVVLLCLVAIFANVLAPQSYTKANFGNIYEFPSREFPLGTDQLGRDQLSRMIYGARVSMLVGLGSQVIVLLIGVPLGALAGFIGGRTDILLTRFIDVMSAFPRLLFVILVMSMLGRHRAADPRPGADPQREGVRGGRARARRPRLACADTPRAPQRTHAHRGLDHLWHPGGH